MKFRYRKTRKIQDLLARIERARILIDELPVESALIDFFRKQSFLNSAVYSAKIEGISTDNSRGEKRLEIQNLIMAIKYIYSNKAPKKLSINFIRQLHKMVMNKVGSGAGVLRQEPSGVFNAAGIAVYVAPSPIEIRNLLIELIAFVNHSKESTSIIASITHIWFEKIHPFLDGNGRVGRLIFSYILNRNGYGMKGAVAAEKCIDKYREDYYGVLAENKKDVTSGVEFLLEALAVSAEEVVGKFKNRIGKNEENQLNRLLPRRNEILEIVQDHEVVTFDFVRRRFMAVSKETIHYDLQQLIKAGLIKKLGKTRGVLYQSNWIKRDSLRRTVLFSRGSPL